MTAKKLIPERGKYRSIMQAGLRSSAKRAGVWMTVIEEQLVKLVAIAPKRLRLTCWRCRHQWTVLVESDGLPRRGWRKCPNHANH